MKWPMAEVASVTLRAVIQRKEEENEALNGMTCSKTELNGVIIRPLCFLNNTDCDTMIFLFRERVHMDLFLKMW